MRIVKVPLEDRSYEIVLDQDNLGEIGSRARDLGLKGKFLIVTNTKVGPLYEETISHALEEAGFSVEKIILPDGENFKTLAVAANIYDKAIEAGLDRFSTIIALGGGVVGDIAGFAAATYMRGINFIQIPTTLLAQVDASVGGKVAVNHPQAKNIIGSFYQPKLVLIDIKTLDTLPKREIKSGLAEIIKYGVIADAGLFSELEKAPFSELSSRKIWLDLIEKSCLIKAAIVEEDELEAGRRMILNYGHTIGHGLEGATAYETYRHGEGVAVGMVGAAYLAHEMGLADLSVVARIKKLVIKMGLPVSFQGIKWEELWLHLVKDKKAQGGDINFILPTEIGRVTMDKVAPDLIKKVVEQELMN